MLVVALENDTFLDMGIEAACEICQCSGWVRFCSEVTDCKGGNYGSVGKCTDSWTALGNTLECYFSSEVAASLGIVFCETVAATCLLTLHLKEIQASRHDRDDRALFILRYE